MRRFICILACALIGLGAHFPPPLRAADDGARPGVWKLAVTLEAVGQPIRILDLEFESRKAIANTWLRQSKLAPGAVSGGADSMFFGRPRVLLASCAMTGSASTSHEPAKVVAHPPRRTRPK
jgi:hypothetical protein